MKPEDFDAGCTIAVRPAVDPAVPNAFCRWCGATFNNPHAATLRDVYGTDDAGRVRDACAHCIRRRSAATFGTRQALPRTN